MSMARGGPVLSEQRRDVNRVLGPSRLPALLTTSPQPPPGPDTPPPSRDISQTQHSSGVCQGGNDISSGTVEKLQTAAEDVQ